MSGTATPAPGPDGTAIRLVVAAGTDHHRFDRLVDWVDGWIAGPAATAGVTVSGLAQVGTSKPSRQLPSAGLVSPAELAAAMAGAHAVVCHAGPGTLLDARRAGVEPIVVPRSAARNEHVDGHQERFAAWMRDRVGLAVASDRRELADMLGGLLTDPQTYRRPTADDGTETVTRHLGDLVDGLLG